MSLRFSERLGNLGGVWFMKWRIIDFPFNSLLINFCDHCIVKNRGLLVVFGEDNDSGGCV